MVIKRKLFQNTFKTWTKNIIQILQKRKLLSSPLIPTISPVDILHEILNTASFGVIISLSLNSLFVNLFADSFKFFKCRLFNKISWKFIREFRYSTAKLDIQRKSQILLGEVRLSMEILCNHINEAIYRKTFISQNMLDNHRICQIII